MARRRPWDEIKARLNDVTMFARKGMTDDQMATALGIGLSTLYKYKTEHPELVEAIKRGKEHSDGNVKRSLYERAMGFELTEEVYRPWTDPETNKMTMVLVERKVKKQPPDTAACIFWLINRCPDEFSNNPHRLDLDRDALSHRKKMDELKEF